LNLLFDLALESAMRMREMFTLDVRQVDLEARTVYLDKTKNGFKRQVPLSSVALKKLRVALRKRTSGRLFPWWDGSTNEKDLARITSRLSRQFARIFEAAGAADLTFHDLRHEATSRIYERTALSHLEIAKITGHRDLRSLARYANLRGSNLASRMW
jgi:integrase